MSESQSMPFPVRATAPIHARHMQPSGSELGLRLDMLSLTLPPLTRVLSSSSGTETSSAVSTPSEQYPDTRLASSAPGNYPSATSLLESLSSKMVKSERTTSAYEPLVGPGARSSSHSGGMELHRTSGGGGVEARPFFHTFPFEVSRGAASTESS